MNGLTQDELGAYLGMQKSFISKIENGRREPESIMKRIYSVPSPGVSKSILRPGSLIFAKDSPAICHK